MRSELRRLATDERPSFVHGRLRLGDLTIRDPYAPAVELCTLPFAADVVFGYNVLRQLCLRIGYRQACITLSHPDLGAATPTGSPTTLPLVFFEHFPALGGVVVAGLPIGLATVDTGSNAALTLGPDLAAELGLSWFCEDAQIAVGTGFGGGSAVLRRQEQAVQIGPLALSNVELDTPAVARGDFGRAGRANVGNRLLARFGTVTLDYERRIVCFEPTESIA